MKSIININDFYQIKKVVYWKNPKGIEWQQYVFQFIIKIYLDHIIIDNDIPIFVMHKSWKRPIIYSRDGYINGCNIFVSSWCGTFKYLKENDYLFISNDSPTEINKEYWWNFLGNLENPNIYLIDLCTHIIDYSK